MSAGDINFMAVGVGAVLAFLLGALWYSPALFHRPWAAVHGYSENEFREMQANAVLAYIVSFVCWFVMCTAPGSLDTHLRYAA